MDASKSANFNTTLLAATWRLESSLNYFPLTNPNNRKWGNADVGPMQLNYNTYHDWSQIADLTKNSFNVFGYTDPSSDNPSEFPSSKFRPYSMHWFNGNPYSNILAGGRLLSSYGGTRESNGETRSNAAGYFRTGRGEFSKTKKGQERFKERKDAFDAEAPKWDKFFTCLNGM